MLLQAAALLPANTSLSTILQGATLAAVLWLFRSIQQLREDHVQFRTVLTGANGDNGINGEVKALRALTVEQGGDISEIKGDTRSLTIRLDAHDRRIGETDRRHA